MAERECQPITEERGATGSLEVLIGPMFSGKSTALLARIDVLSYKDMQAALVKPSNDVRYSADEVVTHNGHSLPAIAIDKEHPAHIIDEVIRLERSGVKVHIVGIDEGHLFLEPEELVDTVMALVEGGKTVIVAGVPTDFKQEPFAAMMQLTARADTITQVKAVCTYRDNEGKVCGDWAPHSLRLVDGEPAPYEDAVIKVGGRHEYEARCRRHHIVPGKPGSQILYEAADTVVK